MIPGEYNFKDQYQDDTFGGAIFTVEQQIGEDPATPIDLTDVDIEMRIAKTKNCNDPIITLTLGSGLTMINATGGEFKIDPFTSPKAYNYFYQITFTYSTLTPVIIQTYLAGKFNVLKDIP